MKKILRIFKSLRFRILLMILIFGIAPSFALRAGLLFAYENRAVQVRYQDISGQAKLLTAQIAANQYLQDPSSDIITTQLYQMSTICDGRIMLIDNSFSIVSDTYQMDEGKLILTEDVMKAYHGEMTQNYDDRYHYIEITMPILDSKTSEALGVMLISVSTDNIETNLVYLRRSAMIVQVLMVMIVIIFGLLIANYTVGPFRRLERSIRAVKDGFEDDFTPVTTYIETETISDACDDMLRRLQTLDESRQEFVSNVSHELKTPLTSMKVLADSLIGQDDIPVEFYREFMTDIGAEIDRENKIINDLLSLVKMDKTSADINIESVNINDLLELLMKRLRPIARKKNVDLVLESFRPVMADVDEVKLSLALSNLIENAIKYNHEEGFVHVSLNADHQNFYVTVEDNGMGIPEESQKHIFERFYRVDKSHSREIGGTGLGLAIARNAIIMHKGQIKVHSVENEGTTFTVCIPLNYIRK